MDAGRREQVHAALAVMFGTDVCVAVTDPKAPQPAVMDVEQTAISNAIPARQLEFAAGRAAARLAMSDLGLDPAAIPAGDDRAPIWPDTMVGSISHTGDICAAVVALRHGDLSLGMDIENASDIEADLIPTLCSTAEQARIAGPDHRRLAKLIFSAKEAAYKAQYPISKMLFGFDHLDVTLDIASASFTATFLKPAAPFKIGDTLPGRFAVVADMLVTGVKIEQNTA
jgi:4'-phosphopantetheinyl transferase EntD